MRRTLLRDKLFTFVMGTVDGLSVGAIVIAYFQHSSEPIAAFPVAFTATACAIGSGYDMLKNLRRVKEYKQAIKDLTEKKKE